MFLTPGGQNMHLKSHQIKKFYQLLQGHLAQERHVGLGRRPTEELRRPTADHLNSAEFGCSEVPQEGIPS